MRAYGTDATDDFETLAEATRFPDGTVHVKVVILDTPKSDGIGPTDATS